MLTRLATLTAGAAIVTLPALAQAAPSASGPSIMSQVLLFLPLILIFIVFYFLLIRPQQKKMKEHKVTLSAIRRGDKVVTGGGIVGTVTKVIDDSNRAADQVASRRQLEHILVTLIPECLQPHRFAWL